MRSIPVFLISLLCLAGCLSPGQGGAPVVQPLPTLVPTLTQRAPVADTPPDGASATPLIAPGSGLEPTVTETPPPAGLPSAPTGGPATPGGPNEPATPTPLIAPPPSATAYSPLAPLAYLPAGEFQMGTAPGTDAYAEEWERPAHTVALSAFWLESVEVSNARYALCVAAGACALPLTEASRTRPDYYSNPQYANYPMVNVTHAQAQSFCAWAGGRLPTEAEWEYAARFPGGRRYPWGNETPDPGRGNFGRPEADTEPVDAYAAGADAVGVLNLAGNVWEWVADWYDAKYYATSPRQDPPGPAAGTERVARGGAFATDPQFVRAANRFGRDPNKGYNNTGFRCAVPQPAPNAPLLPTLTPSPAP